ncbi:hypothetical protein CL619_00080 [archaeon]|nr:hypothetical protein [archaeon]
MVKAQKMAKDTVFIFSAHSDDFVIGCGGTIAKYAKEGIDVRCYVFSYGEKSHPWKEARDVKKMRAEECYEASKILGCKTKIFDLRELNLREDAKSKGTVKTLEKQVAKYKPSRIFLHSKEDPHPDHKAVHALGMQLINRLDKSLIPEVYVYSVWNPFEFKTEYPAMFVPVKESFEKKLEAMRAFPSQRVHVAFPVFMLLFRGFRDGLYSGHRLAEKFFLVKTKNNLSIKKRNNK